MAVIIYGNNKKLKVPINIHEKGNLEAYLTGLIYNQEEEIHFIVVAKKVSTHNNPSRKTLKDLSVKHNFEIHPKDRFLMENLMIIKRRVSKFDYLVVVNKVFKLIETILNKINECNIGTDKK